MLVEHWKQLYSSLPTIQTCDDTFENILKYFNYIELFHLNYLGIHGSRCPCS